MMVDCFAIADLSLDPPVRPDKHRRRLMSPTNPYEFRLNFCARNDFEGE